MLWARDGRCGGCDDGPCLRVATIWTKKAFLATATAYQTPNDDSENHCLNSGSCGVKIRGCSNNVHTYLWLSDAQPDDKSGGGPFAAMMVPAIRSRKAQQRSTLPPTTSLSGMVRYGSSCFLIFSTVVTVKSSFSSMFFVTSL
jgi:hypothetical protein